MRWSWVLVVLLVVVTSVTGQQQDPAPMTMAAAIRDANGDTLVDLVRQHVRVRGVVTIGSNAVAEDRLQIYLQDETAGICVFSRDPGPQVRPGDVIEVTGELGQYRGAPQITRPELAVVGHSEMPQPQAMSIAQAASWPAYGKLVRVRGTLSDVRQEGPNLSYALLGGDGSLRVILPPPVLERFPYGTMEKGTEVEVTGVVSIYSIVPPYREGFRLIVGSPTWITIVARPLPQWIRVTLLTFAALAVLAIVLFLAIRLLRRGAFRRTREIGAMNALSAMASAVVDAEAFLREAAEVVMQSGLVEGFYAHLLEEGTLRAAVRQGFDDAEARAVDDEVRLRFGSKLGERLAVAATTLASARSGRRYLAVPLQGRESAVGVLTVVAPTSAKASGWLIAAANLIALGIESARAAETAEARERELEQLAICDALTGLYNRRFMEEYLRIHMAMARRQKAPVAFIAIDVDGFKGINDRFGHEVGDRVLSHLAELFRGWTRASDLVVRYGGEEFLVVMPGTSEAGAQTFAERFQAALRDGSIPVAGVPADLRITVSIGIAVYPDHADSVRRLLKVADESMYESKRQGRDRITIATGVTRMIEA